MKKIAKLSIDVVTATAWIMFFCMIFVWYGTDPGTTGRILIAIYSLACLLYMITWERYSRKGEK